MAAIISEKFRIFNATQFLESLSEGSVGTEATSDDRTKSYFFVGRPQKWQAYVEIYAVVGTFAVGEQVYVTGSGITLANSPFRATVDAVFPNSILVSNVFPNITAVPGAGSQIKGNTSNAVANAAVYRYATDEIPLRPADNQEEDQSIYDDMIALKRITPEQVRAVVRRYNWNPTVNPKFDMWKPDYSYAKFASVDPDGVGPVSPAQSISNAKFYVANDNYEVFKCLYNGQSYANQAGVNASLQPTTTPSASGQGAYDSATGIFTEFPTVADGGYIWKYLFTIPTNDVIRFLSSDFMPVVTNSVVQNLAATQSGAISAIIIKNAGANLPASTTMYAEIIGNGTGGRVRIETTSTGTIQGAFLCDNSGNRVNISGSGYTYAEIILKDGYLFTTSSLTTPITVAATATGSIDVIIPVKGGHGSDPTMELFAKRVMANIRLTYSEGQGDFPVDNDFRRIGIVQNPKLPAPSTDFATAETLNGLYAVKLNNVSGSFQPDEIVQQETAAGKFAKGTVVSWVFDEVAAGATPTSGVLKYFQSPEYHTDNGVVRGFVSNAAKLITGQTSLLTGAVETTYSTGGAVLPLLGLSFTSGMSNPEVAKYSGDILYVENRRLITRAPDQIEDIKLVIEF